jgi:hypothetical protein
MRIIQMAAMVVLLLAGSLRAPARGDGPAPPHYQLNRADEDYRYLRDPAQRVDFWDPVKFVPLDAGGARYLSLGGEARERFEFFGNPNWGKDPQDSGYLLQRYFLHVDLHPAEHLRLFAQLQSSLESGRTVGARPTDRDELDLHQAFVDLRLDPDPAASFTLRAGRQELAYGSQRIVSVREGPNVRQSFDGFRGMLRLGEWQLDAIATRPVLTKPHLFDDGTDNHRALWGIYSVLPVPRLEQGNLDLYYLGFYNRQARYDQGSAREVRHSLGARLWRAEPPLDYNFEALYQWGRFGTGDIRAWTVGSDTGYRWENLALAPRISLKADIVSGDRDRNNPGLQTFNPLFPKGAYFSEDALIGPANLINLDPTLTLQLTGQLVLTADWDFFWRESTGDGIYNNAVVLVRPDSGSSARYLGSQGQLQLEWNPERHFSLVAIYAHFFAGPFLRESGPSKDVDYLTAWVSYRF